MTSDILAGLSLFALVSSITPGPNNIMLMTSGVNYGVKRTLPHMFGVGIGFTLMVAAVGMGVMVIFDRFPVIYSVLRIVSLSYLLYLAYKIATANQANWQSKSTGKPMTFLQAALFQWVNPKAWTMALTAITVYAPGREVSSILFVAMVFGVINLPCISSWVMAGTKLRHFLSKPKTLRVFNVSMALLLIASVLPSLFN
ncbi:LysE family translocator [Alteromonas sp. ASW11-130]|uniref:LysE family translocator n=1 Tax=Alteromonas sp. ASW11-130 TaxID=3015775 RepID=UPI002241B490|nr:LysE family translocator [Alteromonas sp. ASW11-130]MCW8093357.1 LysE family translocator [Alteromonas sp. ASW11-130]